MERKYTGLVEIGSAGLRYMIGYYLQTSVYTFIVLGVVLSADRISLVLRAPTLIRQNAI